MEINDDMTDENNNMKTPLKYVRKTRFPLTIYTTLELQQRIKAEAKKRSVTVSSVCNIALYDWLPDHGKPKPNEVTETQEINSFDILRDFGQKSYRKDDDNK